MPARFCVCRDGLGDDWDCDCGRDVTCGSVCGFIRGFVGTGGSVRCTVGCTEDVVLSCCDACLLWGSGLTSRSGGCRVISKGLLSGLFCGDRGITGGPVSVCGLNLGI